MADLLVLGGTGFVGRALCETLMRRQGGAGVRVRVPTRRLHRSAHRLSMLPLVDVVETDVHDEAKLAQLLVGVDAVVNLVAVLNGNERTFEQVHVELPRKLVRACRAAGVRRVVHVSALGADAQAPSRYQRSKAAGEAVWRTSGLDVTLLRPSVVFGEEDRFINLFAGLQRVFPLVPLASADAQFQPVWVNDVAQAIVRCLERPSTIGATFECTGPQVFTLADLVRCAGRWSHHPRPVIGLPDVLGRLQALAMELLPGEPLMSRDNLDSAKVPNVASGTLPNLDALGVVPTPIEAVMPPLLDGQSGVARLDALRRVSNRI
jgi:uncharacterized protein YbjT (DUF2867 family)